MLREERSREANGWEHNLELLRIMLGRLGKLNKTSSFRLKPYGIIFYFCSLIHLYLLQIYHILIAFVLQKDYLFKELWKN